MWKEAKKNLATLWKEKNKMEVEMSLHIACRGHSSVHEIHIAAGVTAPCMRFILHAGVTAPCTRFILHAGVTSPSMRFACLANAAQTFTGSLPHLLTPRNQVFFF